MASHTGNMIHSTVPPHQTNRATVHATVSEFWFVLEGLGETWEIVCVNDASRDQSGALLDDLLGHLLAALVTGLGRLARHLGRSTAGRLESGLVDLLLARSPPAAGGARQSRPDPRRGPAP